MLLSVSGSARVEADCGLSRGKVSRGEEEEDVAAKKGGARNGDVASIYGWVGSWRRGHGIGS